jgi:hypothetical protein
VEENITSTYEKVDIGSPKGAKIVEAEVVKGGVKVKANGTAMELLTVSAILIDQVWTTYDVALEDLLVTVSEIITDGAENTFFEENDEA